MKGPQNCSLPCASAGASDFFDLACSLWLESSQEHLPTSIAGVPSTTLRTGSSTARHKTLCYAIDLRGASLSDSVGELTERVSLCREPGRTAGPSPPPDFLSKTVASVDFMLLSLRRAA